MTEIYRYKVVAMLSEEGNRIGYDPHGPEVVMASAYDQLKAENEALRKDAERYRWLRKVAPSTLNKMQSRAMSDGGDVFYFHAARFDPLVDAAMAKETQP